MSDQYQSQNLRIHVTYSNALTLDDVNMPQRVTSNLNHATTTIAAQTPSKQASPIISKTVEAAVYKYVALTDQVIEQHKYHYDATTIGTHPSRDIESTIASPYQRCSGYNPIITSLNDNVEALITDYVMIDTSSCSNTLSTITQPQHTDTTSNVTSPSYSDTSLNTYQSTSSTHAQPEYEPYTFDHGDDGHWRTQMVGYSMEYFQRDLAGIGGQFGGDSQASDKSPLVMPSPAKQNGETTREDGNGTGE